MEIEDIRIERYQPQSGDLLVVHLAWVPTDFDVERIQNAVRARVGPEVGVVVLQQGCDMTVLRKAEHAV